MPDGVTKRDSGASREEFEVWHERVRNALSNLGFPATKADVTRRLGAVADSSPLSKANLRALPNRRYENPADVRYTLETLGAYPGSDARE